MSNAPHILESPEEVLSTLEKSGQRRWLYPVVSKGRLYWQRLITGWLLIVIFVCLPWIKIAGRPAIFLDIARREFTFFGLTLHSTDTVLLMVFLLTSIVGVFFATALFGRVWCGWGCPQTVYLEFVFRPIERLFEGSEAKRRRRDKGPWNFDKTWRKGLKFSVFLLISLFLAHTFVAYFASWDFLLVQMGQSPLQAPGYFVMMALTTGLVLFNFGYFREQMCTITCPYARFQSVLMDENSLIVSYDPSRGEQRATARARKQAQNDPLNLDGTLLGFGDCVDCGACVRTCPVGIDIRNGLQMECISCTQCIDACNDIMDAVGTPRGLIRYTSENAIEGRPTRVLRPRLLAYAVLLLALSTLLTGIVFTRSTLEVDVQRARGTTYMITADEDVANRLRFRLRNRTNSAQAITIVPVSPEGATLRIVGDQTPVLPPGEILRFEAWVTVPREQMPPGGETATFEILVGNEVLKTLDFRLLGPLGPATQSATGD